MPAAGEGGQPAEKHQTMNHKTKMLLLAVALAWPNSEKFRRQLNNVIAKAKGQS
jgi:hypothetical protein